MLDRSRTEHKDATSHHSTQENVAAELVNRLYAQGNSAIIGSLLTALCVFFGLENVSPLSILLPWLLSVVVVSALRFSLILAYKKAKPSIEDAHFWQYLFVAANVASGCVWMVLGTLLVPTETIYQVLIAFALAGVVAGAVSFFAASPQAAITFIMLVLPPFGITMFLHQDMPHQIVGFLSFIYLAALITLTLRIHKQLRDALNLHYANAELIHKLSTSHHEVEKMNQTLQLEISERKTIESLLRNSEEQYRLVTDALPVLIAYIDNQFYFRFNNHAYEEWFKKPLKEINSRPIKDVLGETAFMAFLENHQKLATEKQVNYETTMYFHDDQERYVSVTLIPHMLQNEMQGVFSLISDMTPRINYLATHDALTSLPNRSLFNARLAHALKHAQRHGTQVALLFLDLDHFKKVNDTLGHDVGDQLLMKVVERLQACIREHDTLARIGGDEFTIILPDITDLDSVAGTAKDLCDSLSAAFKINERGLFITTSIGISLYPNDGDNMQTLLKNADMAMYRAKERGRNTFEFYTHGMNEAIQRKIKIESELRHILDGQDLKIYYQPLIDLKHNKITSYEALLRWFHPEMGLIPSGEFISIAEETGLMPSIGEWVLRNACMQNKCWHDAGYQPRPIAVNLSSRQFMKANIAQTIASILQETGLKGKYLTLEITESSIMRDFEHAIKVVKELKALDITIAIDDFGTGYSSLGHLKRFSFDVIKIDRSFITDFSLNPDDAAIVKAIIAMAHSLKMKVVAEGVEEPEQYMFLKEQGCDEIQGYLFYPPLPETEFEAVLKNGVVDLVSGNVV